MSNLKQILLNKKPCKLIWFMRQAGRYLPEFRKIRTENKNFIKLCMNSSLASEITLQPIKRFDLDAAIIFSDILIVPYALGQDVTFKESEGPKLSRFDSKIFLKTSEKEFSKKLAPIYKAIELTRKKLNKKKSLISFVGAPWTLMTYMAEGGSSRDFATSRNWLWSDKSGVEKLTAQLIEAIIQFLALQAKAGANVLMLFDSWAGAVPASHRQFMVVDPAQKIISGLRARGINQPVIYFPKQLGEGLIDFADNVDCQAIAIDHNTDIRWAAKTLPKHITLQGNLDPLALLSAGPDMQYAVDDILEACSQRPHIFNLGHGITPPTPPEHLAKLISLVRGQ